LFLYFCYFALLLASFDYLSLFLSLSLSLALFFALLPPFASCLIRKSRIYPKGMLAFYFIIYNIHNATSLTRVYSLSSMLCKLITFFRDSKLLSILRNCRFTKITASVLLPENDFIFLFFFIHLFYAILCLGIFIRQLKIFFY